MEIDAYLGISRTEAAARVLERARRYVAFETPSRSEKAIAGLAALIRADLEAIGLTVETTPVPGLGVNLLATLKLQNSQNGQNVPNDQPIVIMAHIDTVHPMGTLERMPLEIEDGKAFGPGIYDMKSGLATAIEALAWLQQNRKSPKRTVQLLITCDEEIGSHSARETIAALAKTAAAVLVPEPCLATGGVKTFRKGVATYVIRATGIAAHAGIDGLRAVSATRELVQALNDVIDLKDHDKGTTLNIGSITGGGASNVVAAEAEAVVDVRLAESAEEERIHEAMLSLTARHPQATLTAARTESRPPLVRTPEIAALYEKAKQIAKDLGVDLAEGGTGGGSDGSLAAAAGAPTLDGLGPQGAGAHAIDEHILVEDLPFRLALMASLLETL